MNKFSLMWIDLQNRAAANKRARTMACLAAVVLGFAIVYFGSHFMIGVLSGNLTVTAEADPEFPDPCGLHAVECPGEMATASRSLSGL